MNRTSVAQQAKTSNLLPPAQGILQRKCACGNKTIAGGECTECAKKKNSLQRKLTIGASNDPFEREADRVADQVMAMPTNSNIGRTAPRIQRLTGQSVGQADTAPASVDRVLSSSGRPMEPTIRQDMEQRFGHDFSQVRVHSGAAAERSAQDVSAHAYTAGNNIVFGAGGYRPSTNDGQKLIAHELTHVIQQKYFTPSNNRTLNRKDKKKSKGMKAKDVAEFKFEPSVNGEPCACLVFVHNDEKSAKKIAHTMHKYCKYNFASVQGSGRCIPMPGEPGKGSCKKGTIDPNELFPKNVAEKCFGNTHECEKFITDNANTSDSTTIKEVAQHNYFLAISKCSKDFTLPVVALHNNAVNDTASYRTELEKKRPKAGSTNPKQVQKGVDLQNLLDKLKVDINKTPGAKTDSLTDLKDLLNKKFKTTKKGILYGQKGKTNIFRWCASSDLNRCHVGDPEHPDHVVWTTNINDYEELSKKDVNVALQKKPPSSATPTGGTADTDLSTLFLFMEQIFTEQVFATAATLIQKVTEDINDIVKIIEEIRNLAENDDLLFINLIEAALRTLLNILEIIIEIELLLGVIVGGALRINKLRYVNIETPSLAASTKRDPAKFDYIIDVLEPLGLNCCDKASQATVRNELGTTESSTSKK